MITVEEANASGFVLVHGWRTGRERLMQVDNIIHIYEDKPESHRRQARRMGIEKVTFLEVARGTYAAVSESVRFVLAQIERANLAVYETVLNDGGES